MRLGMPMPMGTPRSILFDIVRPLDDEDEGGNGDCDGDEDEGGNDDEDGDEDESGNGDEDRDDDEGVNDDEDGAENVDEALFEGAVVKERLAAEVSEVERALKVADGCTWWSVGRKYWPGSSWWPASAQPSLSPSE